MAGARRDPRPARHERNGRYPPNDDITVTSGGVLGELARAKFRAPPPAVRPLQRAHRCEPPQQRIAASCSGTHSPRLRRRSRLVYNSASHESGRHLDVSPWAGHQRISNLPTRRGRTIAGPEPQSSRSPYERVTSLASSKECVQELSDILWHEVPGSALTRFHPGGYGSGGCCGSRRARAKLAN